MIYLILLFTLLPACELLVLIEVGSVIGSLNTIMIIILTGVLGAALARYQGFLILRNIQKELHEGRVPNEQLLDGLMILVGGIVLLTPGFITDAIGFLLLIPLTRTILKLFAQKIMKNIIRTQSTVEFRSFHQKKNKSSGYDDIDIN